MGGENEPETSVKSVTSVSPKSLTGVTGATGLKRVGGEIDISLEGSSSPVIKGQ